MDQVGAAVFLAQPVVSRAGIEQKNAAPAPRIGGLEQRVRRQVGDDERNTAPRKVLDRGGRIVGILQPYVLEREALVEEFSGRIVVLDRQPGARDTVIGGRNIEQRDRGFDLGAAQIADLDLDRLGQRDGGHGEQRAGCDEVSIQAAAPAGAPR